MSQTLDDDPQARSIHVFSPYLRDAVHMRELVTLSTSGGTSLCLDDDGRLVVLAADGAVPLDESLPALLPALDRSRNDFLSDLQERAGGAGFEGEDIWRLVPEQELLLLGLSGDTGDYWTTRALRWAAEIELTPELRAAVTAVADDGATQRLRHDATRVLSGRRPKS